MRPKVLVTNLTQRRNWLATETTAESPNSDLHVDHLSKTYTERWVLVTMLEIMERVLKNTPRSQMTLQVLTFLRHDQ